MSVPVAFPSPGYSLVYIRESARSKSGSAVVSNRQAKESVSARPREDISATPPPRIVASPMKSHVQTCPRWLALVGNPVETPRRMIFRLVAGTRGPAARRDRWMWRLPTASLPDVRAPRSSDGTRRKSGASRYSSRFPHLLRRAMAQSRSRASRFCCRGRKEFDLLDHNVRFRVGRKEALARSHLIAVS